MCLCGKVSRGVSRAEVDRRYLDRVGMGGDGEEEGTGGTGEQCGGSELEEGLTDDTDGMSGGWVDRECERRVSRAHTRSR